jgi:hypothetical protein
VSLAGAELLCNASAQVSFDKHGIVCAAPLELGMQCMDVASLPEGTVHACTTAVVAMVIMHSTFIALLLLLLLQIQADKGL